MSLTIPVSEIVAQSHSSLLSQHETWSRIILGEIAEVVNGFAFPSDRFQREKGVPLIRIRDILSNSTDCLFDGDFDNSFLIHKGDLLIGMDGDFNCALWQGPTGLLNQRVCWVKPRSEFFNQKFLFYLLPAYLKAINDATSSVTVKHLSSKSVEDIPLPLPPLAEQQRIVEAIEQKFSCLDEGVALLRQAQKRLKLYRASVLKAAVEGELTTEWRATHPDLEPASELLQRILAERRAKWEEEQSIERKGSPKTVYIEPMVPKVGESQILPYKWIWTTLSALTINGPQNGIYLPQSKYGKGVPILRIDDFQNGTSKLSSQLRLVDASHEDIAKYTLKEEDLIINRVNSPSHLGKCLIISDRNLPSLFESNMMRLHLSQYTNAKFVEFYLHSNVGRKNLTKNAKWAVNQASINQNDVNQTIIPLPPLVEQAQIVALVEERLSIIGELESAIEKALKRAERQRQSILHQAFTGRLVPQNPDDEPAIVLLDRIRQEREQEKQKKQAIKIKPQTNKNKKPFSSAQTSWLPDGPVEPIDSTGITQESLWQGAEVSEVSILVDGAGNNVANADKEKSGWSSAIIRSGTQK